MFQIKLKRREKTSALFCSSAGCHFLQWTPRPSGSRSSPPTPRSLKHDCQCDSGSQLGQWLPSPPSRHPIPACLGLQTEGSDPLAQFPALHGGTRLGTEVERLEWGQKRERMGEGEEDERAHLNRYFLSPLPLLSFSPYYQSVWCRSCPI